MKPNAFFCSRARCARTSGRGAAGYSALRTIGMIAALAATTWAGDATNKEQPLPDDQKARIEEAASSLKASKPSRPRKLLIFDRTEGFYHGCIPAANAALEVMGRKTGAFEPVVSKDMASFDAKNLASFDAVLFNNTTRLSFGDPAQRQALMDFVKGGKGIAGIHAASDNFYEWPEAAEMMGGVFDGHPWGAGGTWAIKIDEPGHPLCRGFKSPTFMLKDEIYQVKGAYSRDTLRVLASLDMSGEANWKVDTNQIHRTDKDFGIAWIRPFGKGRMFYSSFGHNNEIYWNPEVMQHFLDGIQYALGDNPVDDRPSAAVAGAKALESLGGYTEGSSRAGFARIEEDIRTNDPEKIEAAAAILLKLLADPASTRDAKEYACRLLARTGSPKAVAPLAGLLANPELSTLSRFALEKIPGEASTAALRDALARCNDDRIRIGLVTSLARKQDEKSVAALVKLCASTNALVAGASLSSLGQIGGSAAFKALVSMKGPPALEAQRVHALLAAADRVGESDLKRSADVFKKLMGGDHPLPIRMGALSCLVRTGDASACERVVAALKSQDAGDRAMGLRFAAEVKGGDLTRSLCLALPALAEQDQVALLAALTVRGDDTAATPVAALAGAGSEAVRIAAIRALGELGGAAQVPMLVETAIAGGGMGEAARTSLARLRGNDAQEAIRKLLASEDGAKRALGAQLAAARNDKGALPLLVKAVQDADAGAGEAAAQALGQMAGESEWKPLLQGLVTAKDAKLRAQMEKALSRLAGRLQDPSAALRETSAALNGAGDELKVSLLNVIGSIGTAEALAIVGAQATTEDNEVSRTAVRQLSQWKDPAALDVLLKIAGPGYASSLQRLALRGAVQVTERANGMKPEDKMAAFRKLMDAATDRADRVMILSAIGKAGGAESWAFIAPYVSNPEFAQEATAALKQAVGDKGFVEVKGASATAHADGAKIVGSGAEYEKADDRKCVGVWKDVGTKVNWLLAFEEAGTYEVLVNQSAAGDAGGEYVVALGSKKLEGRVKTTPGWDKFEQISVGKVTVEAPGTQLLSVAPVKIHGGYLMNLRDITLQKEPPPSAPVAQKAG
jgi:type 1 glutamine amidotransferase/HEAT repeat protein